MTTRENLGPAETIIQTLLAYSDHVYHGRCGAVSTDARSKSGVSWVPVTYRVDATTQQKVVYRITKQGKKQVETKLGVLNEADNKITNDANKVVGEYRSPGIFPEVATWFYQQIAEVWKLDNEFAAKWASFAFTQEHKDLKVILAAFMLVQSRKGDPVIDAGKIAFHDEDYRDVGEAMMLTRRKDDKDLDPKMLLRIREVLTLPAVAAINRELGFGQSARKAFLGRWTRTVEKYLQHREENPKMLDALVKAGYRQHVIRLARYIGYKPETTGFFATLRWKQAQADDGRRTIAIGEAVKAAESWDDFTETQVCEKIIKDKLDWKGIVGRLPKKIGVTRAVVAAAIEAKSLSPRDLIIATPTLEELGLLEVPAIRVQWEKATKQATDTRAANIARNVHGKALKEKLVEAADTAVKKAIEVITKNLRTYVVVDVSGSMAESLERAKVLCAKFVQGFPLEQLHVVAFNTVGKIITIRHASAAGVENAFKGITASGGTAHASAIRALADFRPKEDEDTLIIFVGDEGEARTFEGAVATSGLRPMAFGLLRIPGELGNAVSRTAALLGIPCFEIEERTFDDAYAIPRTLRNLVGSTPVGVAARAAVAPRVTLVDQILATSLLSKPQWA